MRNMFLFFSFIFIGVIKLKTLFIETKKKQNSFLKKILNIKIKQIIKKTKNFFF